MNKVDKKARLDIRQQAINRLKLLVELFSKTIIDGRCVYVNNLWDIDSDDVLAAEHKIMEKEVVDLLVRDYGLMEVVRRIEIIGHLVKIDMAPPQLLNGGKIVKVTSTRVYKRKRIDIYGEKAGYAFFIGPYKYMSNYKDYDCVVVKVNKYK